MRSLILAFLLGSALFVTVPIDAAILYVDNTQSCPGDGSSSTPYCSIQNAINNVNAGDNIRIRTGTGVYSETASVSGRNGTAANPIIIERDAGANFVIQNTNAGAQAASIRIKESEYWTVRNLVFDANGVSPSKMAVHIQCETKDCVGIVISGNTFRNWRQAGDAPGAGPQVIEVSGCVTELGCPQARFLTAVIENNLIENSDHRGISLMRTLNTHVRNNEIRNIRCGRNPDTSTNALGMHLTYGNIGLQVYDNHIHDFVSKANCPLPNGGYATTAGIWGDVCSVAGEDTLSQNVQIYRNRIHDMDAGVSDLGGTPNGGLAHASQGLFVEANCQGWKVHDNFVYNIGSFGIRNDWHALVRSQPLNEYYNNTIFNIANNAILHWKGVASYKNNIIFSTGNSIWALWAPAEAVITADFNLYNDGGSQTKIAAWSGVGLLNLSQWKSQCNCDQNTLTGNPLFVNAAGADFHLQAGSPARGSGEGGVDIGAYPYSGSVVSAPAAPSGLAATLMP